MECRALFETNRRLFQRCLWLFLSDSVTSSLQHVLHLEKLLLEVFWRQVGLGGQCKAMGSPHARAGCWASCSARFAVACTSRRSVIRYCNMGR